MRDDLAALLLRHGYDALPLARSRRHEADDAFEARMLGRRTLVVRGEQGARMFYDESRMRRRRAVPPPLAHLLFGRGAVHGLDGEEHRVRKQVFLDLLSDEAVADLARRVDERLDEALRAWALGPGVRVHEGLVRIYGIAVLEWAGTGCAGLRGEEVARDLAAIVDGFGFSGRAYVKAWAARRRAEAWAADLVRRTRDGRHHPPEGTAVHAFSVGAGAALPVRVAAVELLNVLRPTVAVSWLGTFAALALAQHPGHAAPLLGPDADRHLVAFAHEVRRRTPFVPALTALATTPFRFGGHDVRRGDRVVLDVPGTNHHPDQWAQADDFCPARFVGSDPDPFRFVPQGGGGPLGHRCPGEDVTTALLVVTLRHLSRARFTLRSPDVRTDRMPTLPSEELLMTDVSPGEADGTGPFVPAG